MLNIFIMKVTKPHDQILDYIKNHPGATCDDIREDNPKIVDTILYKVLGELQAQNLLESNDEDGGYTFHGRISA